MSLNARTILYILCGVIWIALLASMIDIILIPDTTPTQLTSADRYLTAHELPTPPSEFTHDGCTLWPDYLLWHDFTDACLQHDIAYWAGGTSKQKIQADLTFYETVQTTGPLGKFFASPMFSSVYLFGESWIIEQLGAEWGYGWN